MSTPPPMLSYVSPPPPLMRRPAWWIAWVLILAAIATINVRMAMAGPGRAHVMDSMKLELIGRYVVGVHALFGNRFLPAGTRGQLLDSVDQVARSDEDKARAAVIAGELVGPREAADRLGRLGMLPVLPNPPPGSPVGTLKRLYDGGVEGLSAGDREELTENYGWFGELALARGLPSWDPARQAAVGPAVRTAVALIGCAVLGVFLGIAGLALSIVAVALLVKGTLKVRLALPAAESLHPTALLEPLAVFLTIYLGVGLLLRVVGTHFAPLSFLAGLAMLTLFVAAPLAIFWPLLRGMRWGQWRAAMGLEGNPLREIPCGLVGYVAGLPLFAVGTAFTLLLVNVSHASPTHPITEQVAGSSILSVIFLYLLAAVWAPVTEELIFRGALFAHLRVRHSFVVSALGNAVLFAAIHPQGWTLIPALGSLAVVFSSLRAWRGSIYAPMAAHAFHNGMLVTFLLLVLS